MARQRLDTGWRDLQILEEGLLKRAQAPRSEALRPRLLLPATCASSLAARNALGREDKKQRSIDPKPIQPQGAGRSG